MDVRRRLDGREKKRNKMGISWQRRSGPRSRLPVLIGSRHSSLYDIIFPLSSSFLSKPEHLLIKDLV